MSQKTRTIITIILIAVVGLGVLGYILVWRSKSQRASQTSNQPFGENSVNVTIQTPATPQSEGYESGSPVTVANNLIHLSTTPSSAGIVVQTSGTSIARYVDRSTGHVMSV